VVNPLDVTAVLVIYYWKRTHDYKFENENIREKKRLEQLKSITH